MSFEQPKFVNSKESKIEKKEFSYLPECVRNAENALQDFLKLKPEERVLFLEDKKTNRDVILILKEAIQNMGSSWEKIVLKKETKRREIQNLLKENEIVIDLSVESSQATENLLDEDIKKFGNRALALYDIDTGMFKEGGALTEKLEDLEWRLNKMETLLKNAVGFRITSVYGTNLEVELRPFKERRWFKDTGVIEGPGQWDNLPGGEIFTTPDEGKVNGTLVLPALDSIISPEQGVDEFINLKIKNGKIVLIQGGKSAEKLRKNLEEMAYEAYKERKNPWDVYQCAELAFGANSKARSVVADPDQPYNFPGVSTVETEKRLGTIHIAFGDTKHGEEGTEGFVETVCHYDFVIPRNGLTVEMFNNEEDFKKKVNGRKIINRGGLNFF
ncbi:MAG: hypothetical protein COY82_00605 [Parcubacteria group bacterium CG_4_10_14_0_8_um_filter_35_7]|nr:MAG: hypothetical protein COX43_01485 [Parcubacteria group bacterium CG23_combo_of_CG06-09_8_20_14_all_35_9]PIY78788.1 MAG: hypothetical protein COY82_00605 [Parcubacteria group bacterium CG_4_10_14_0_8_um_filter_35_7]